MENTLVFDISQMTNLNVGDKETYSFEAPLTFDAFTAKSSVTGKAEIMRIEDGFNTRLLDLEVSVEFECDLCLKKFDQKIAIKSAERIFLFKTPEKIDDTNDLYLINSKEMTIDVTELLRQEIILHFPLIPVCSKSCKGICPVCGKDRNKTACKCQPEKEVEAAMENKPLAGLKDLLKKSKNNQ